MKFSNLTARITDLEAIATAGKIPTTDKDGRRCWLEHSGIGALGDLMHFERLAEEAGHELTRADLPPELMDELDLWSRAEITDRDGVLAVMVQTEAKRIFGESL